MQKYKVRSTLGFCRTSQPVDHCRVPCSMVLWLIDARLWDPAAVSGCVQPPAHRNHYWWKDPDCSRRDIRPDWSGLPRHSGATQSQEKNSLIIPIVKTLNNNFGCFQYGNSLFSVLFFLRWQIKSALRFPQITMEQLGIGQPCRRVKRIRSADSSRPSSSRSHNIQRDPHQRSESGGLPACEGPSRLTK